MENGQKYFGPAGTALYVEPWRSTIIKTAAHLHGEPHAHGSTHG